MFGTHLQTYVLTIDEEQRSILIKALALLNASDSNEESILLQDMLADPKLLKAEEGHNGLCF